MPVNKNDAEVICNSRFLDLIDADKKMNDIIKFTNNNAFKNENQTSGLIVLIIPP